MAELFTLKGALDKLVVVKMIDLLTFDVALRY